MQSKEEQVKMHRKVGYRPTWAEVNLKNLEYNFTQIKRKIGKDILTLATVKADAYGHGLIPVAKKLSDHKVGYFGVASIDEGIRLRQAHLKQPILILGMILKEDIPPLFRYNLIPTVCTFDLARHLDVLARKLKRTLHIHIKVDTGMSRLGVMHEDAFTFVKRILQFKHLSVEGLFTHFAFADLNRDFTLHQIKLFDELVKRLAVSGVHIPIIHAANSLGIVGFKKGHYNMVRPGLILYGLYPKQGIPIDLKPVLSLKTKVVFLKRLPKGRGISYGHTYVTRKDTTIVTLPIGYGDGYPRNLSNIAPVLLRGKRFRICGRVCMDQIMLDVGDTPVRIGDEAVLIGSQADKRITAEELADLAGTIPYEIVCGLGNRVPRVYV